MATQNFSALLFTWDWIQPAGAVLLITLGLYWTGWWRLRRNGHYSLANKWRLASYSAGQLACMLALLSGIDTLQSSLFFMHMIQHLLLLMLAPPLLWLGNPLAISLWGFPRYTRLMVGRWLRPQAQFRRILRSSTSMGTSWLAFVAITILWHDPTFYQLALRNEIIHDIEHLSFFISGLMFWWHITGANPRIHRQYNYGMRIGLVILTIVPNQILGVFLALSDTVFYQYYNSVPRVLNLTPLADQNMGGVIMWIPGSMMYALTALILFIVAGNRVERK